MRNAEASSSSHETRNTLIVCAGTVLIMLLAMPTLRMIANEWSLEIRARSFKSTTGELLSVATKKYPGAGVAPSLAVIPEYEYTIDGAAFKSFVMRPFPNHFPGRVGKIRAKELSVVTNVEVFFNPSNPQESVLFLDPGDQSGGLKAMLVIATAFLVVALLALARVLVSGIRRIIASILSS